MGTEAAANEITISSSSCFSVRYEAAMCLLSENIASSFVEVWRVSVPGGIYWIIVNVSCSFYQSFLRENTVVLK